MQEIIECKCTEVTLDELSQHLVLITTDKNLSNLGIIIYAPFKMSMGIESKLYGKVKPNDLVTLTVEVKEQELRTRQEICNEWSECGKSNREEIKVDL